MNIGREIGIVRIVGEPQAVTEPVEEPAWPGPREGPVRVPD